MDSLFSRPRRASSTVDDNSEPPLADSDSMFSFSIYRGLGRLFVERA